MNAALFDHGPEEHFLTGHERLVTEMRSEFPDVLTVAEKAALARFFGCFVSADLGNEVAEVLAARLETSR